jgi:hypothetical protein
MIGSSFENELDDDERQLAERRSISLDIQRDRIRRVREIKERNRGKDRESRGRDER